MPSNEAVSALYAAHQQELEDAVLNALIAEDLSVKGSDCKVGRISVSDELKRLGIKSLQVSGSRYIFKLAESGSVSKQLVFEASAFQRDSMISDRDLTATYTRINDNWAIATSGKSAD